MGTSVTYASIHFFLGIARWMCFSFFRAGISHSVIATKFLRIASPAGPLFSGWNCTPSAFPHATADAYGTIYSVEAIVASGVVSA